MSKTYSYKEPIDNYINISLYDWLHPDFRNYYSAFVAGLEQLFEVKILTSNEYLSNPGGNAFLILAAVGSI